MGRDVIAASLILAGFFRSRFQAGTLYLAIVVCLIIAIISSSVILVASHYRNNYQKAVRYQVLTSNLNSAVLLALNSKFDVDQISKIDLFHTRSDSVMVDAKTWGAFELLQVASFEGKDTLRRIFLTGVAPDSTALYMSDEDRPLSVSGSSRIIGNVMLPKSGIRKAYAEGKGYSGETLVAQGKIQHSNRSLPPLKEALISSIVKTIEYDNKKETRWISGTKKMSYLMPTQVYRLESPYHLNNSVLMGNIVIWSDSVIEVGTQTKLDGVILMAPAIHFSDRFSGNVQAFATDTIIVGENTQFDYPSVLAILRAKRSPKQPLLKLEKGTSFSGWLINQDNQTSQQGGLIALASGVAMEGEIYCNGTLKLEKGAVVKGKTSCNRFLVKTPSTLYENFLIDIRLSSRDRDLDFLNPAMMGGKGRKNIVQWLN